LKYWLLTTEYPPMHGGGISTYCYHTAIMLAENGYTITVFVNDDSVTDFIIEQQLACRVVRFNSNRHHLQASLGYTARLSYSFAGIVRQLIEREGAPRCIEMQDYLGIGYYLTQFKHAGYSFLENIPLLCTIHSPAFIYLLYNRVPVYRFPDYWTGEMEKQAIIAADALISPSHYLVAALKKHISLQGKEPAVIANPYSTSTNAGSGFKRNRIVYYGKLSAQKGSFALLKRFAGLWDKGFSHPLHMIGGTDIVYHPAMKTMGELVKEQYGGYITKGLLQLHGKITPDAISTSLSDAHLVIVPSIVDNMPYVVMEAMSMGKVVLVSAQGGQAEMVEEGLSGFVFDHDDPFSFEKQLNAILAMTDEGIQQMGHNAARRIKERYGYETVASQKTAFIEQLVTGDGSTKHFPFLYQQPIQELPLAMSGESLSIVVPYYNMHAYIDECISSLQESTYQPAEILVINDGSTAAETDSKLAAIAAMPDVTVMNIPHAGLAAARNFGALAARGGFLAFIDPDDKVHPSYYEKAIALLRKKQNVFFVGAWVQYFENSQRIWPSFTPQPPYALVHNPVNSSSLVYKKAAFLKGGLNDAKTDYGLEDYESMVSMLQHGYNGVILPETLFYYRVRTGSMFRDITRAKLLYSNGYITQKHHDYYNRFATDIINLLNANGPGYLYDNPTFATTVTVKGNTGSALVSRLKSFIKKNEPLKKMALQLLKMKSRI
jgi:glycosyltransferase involved in cell wall biosynthesis